MEIEWEQQPQPELTPSECNSIDDWASDTSSIDDILGRKANYERTTELFQKAYNTEMTPVIDPHDVEAVRIVRWTKPPANFHIIDPPPKGAAWEQKQPPVKIVQINKMCKRNPAAIQLALPRDIPQAKKQLQAIR